jgi:putative PIN family toxin of toxin-antitoxin system
VEVHRVVIDTNVLISGIIQSKGYPYKIVKLWEKDELILITSFVMINEAEKVLNYPRIKKNYKLNDEEIKQTILNLSRYSILINNLPSLNVIKDDPDDNAILSTAVEGKADYIISGDSHLLVLKDYKGIKIITPKKFCEIVGL